MTTTAGCTSQNRSDRRCRRRNHQALHAAVADLKAACTPPQPPPEGPSAVPSRRRPRTGRPPAACRHPPRRRSQIGRATTRLGVRPTPETRERGDPPPPPSALGLSPAASSGGGGGKGGRWWRPWRLRFEEPPETGTTRGRQYVCIYTQSVSRIGFMYVQYSRPSQLFPRWRTSGGMKTNGVRRQ